ncbi:uncharacterized protein MEPE_04238 [Melanopsichium pennsylvanicum]|uniref:Uncharacterized protein n=2 Tax=Melanopsichium pennsylvanicum TaxID=63383 RepID=A0AAJ5C6I5_9BASI|nr:uncharacterized protein MEPE_04238 [Melanopsichium pennsylvanicum]
MKSKNGSARGGFEHDASSLLRIDNSVRALHQTHDPELMREWNGRPLCSQCCAARAAATAGFKGFKTGPSRSSQGIFLEVVDFSV